ncbi:SDR family NAD(P)-dependent oxidoreductase [Bordetella sp. 15P40C-2]|uniref:SDR family NAD(P)-dependent oxidoreductase n=1 Tax=Bordetella sp. 15P40C-2 TaxID=2572246 RepID=UPI001320B460|nr:SDR family NAD(P)-dependent oxidoreductase [Bordetella sp. 15P40C-2]MVW70328.1 SDR family oxidoreductase [Bordetella sp. 15P40C-2]
MMQRLASKVAIVMGAGSREDGWSNGKAAAALYAREGALVYAVDVDLVAAERTRDIILDEGGVCAALRADITVSSDIKAVVDTVLRDHGRIDVLHNNVGITAMGDVVEASEESWRSVLDTNLTGVFLTCKHVLPVMQAQQSGAIVNISSLASIQVNHYPYPSYSAAKAGLNQLTRAMAVQYASQGIRVNAVLPGVMDTPMIYRQIAGEFDSIEAMRQRRNAASPMGRMGDAWDVAHAALFLVSDEAKYITGVCLPVDGGKSCAGR